MSHSLKQLFIVGGQRSGTTFLTQILNQHPQIKFLEPIFPETRYFIKNLSATAVDFEQEFKLNEEEISKYVISEKSTSYFENKTALKGIKRHFPDATIIFLVRDPLERTLSNYYYSYKNGLETRTLDEVFVIEKQQPLFPINLSVNPFDYLGRSDFIKHISILEEIFTPGQLIYINFKELIDKPNNTINKVVEKLNISDYKFSLKVSNNSATRFNQPSNEVKTILYKVLQAQYEFLFERKLL